MGGHRRKELIKEGRQEIPNANCTRGRSPPEGVNKGRHRGRQEKLTDCGWNAVCTKDKIQVGFHICIHLRKEQTSCRCKRINRSMLRQGNEFRSLGFCGLERRCSILSTSIINLSIWTLSLERSHEIYFCRCSSPTPAPNTLDASNSHLVIRIKNKTNAHASRLSYNTPVPMRVGQ